MFKLKPFGTGGGLTTMKKILFASAIFFCANAYSQIKDLEGLFGLSSASVSDLTTLHSYGWQVMEPEESYSKDKKNIIQKYKFIFSEKDKKQIVEREINISTIYNFKMSSTNFYSNDWEVLKKMKADLVVYGYKPKKSAAPYFSFYYNGRSSISIVDKPTKEVPELKAGYYMVKVFGN